MKRPPTSIPVSISFGPEGPFELGVARGRTAFGGRWSAAWILVRFAWRLLWSRDTGEEE